MTMRHGNRIRQGGGERAARDSQDPAAAGMASGGPTEDEIRQRAHEIYLSRNGAPGNADVDWLQAEIELRTRKAKVRPN